MLTFIHQMKNYNTIQVLHASPSKSHLVAGIRKAIADGGFAFNAA
jgi:hypothetical protein